MKKIISALSLAVLTLLLTSCGGEEVSVTPVTRGISFTAELTYYNENYEAAVTVSENGETVMEITYPDNIKGLTFKFNGEEVTAEFAGLEYKTDFKAFSEGACCMRLYEILKDTFNEESSVIKEGDNYCISGQSGDISYKMYLGGAGLPISAGDSGGFTVNFKNVTILK